MNNTLKTVKLEKGEVTVYDYGKVKLHAYKTNDPLADEYRRSTTVGSPIIFGRCATFVRPCPFPPNFWRYRTNT